MTLRHSISLAKEKWKKGLSNFLNDTDTPYKSIQDMPAGTMTWSGIKVVLAVLEAGSEAFGPLKSAIGGLNECIAIFQSASKGRKDYAELHEKLNGLLNDLAKHMTEPMGLEMTNSVNQLCRGIEEELKNVKVKQAQNRIQQLARAGSVSDEIYECYRRIHGHLERLTLDANLKMIKDMEKIQMKMIKDVEVQTESLLNGMSPAKSAVYNSDASDEIKRGTCAPGTREPQIELLLEWAHNPETGRTCWMNGMAGTGKTTIAYTVCSKLEESSKLGASFFCSRTIPECRQVKRIIPSIAYQLARFSLPFRCALAGILGVDPDVHTRALKIQYQKLIVDPLVAAKDSLPLDLIVIIDALDECENEDSVGQILDLVLSTPPSLPIRFLLSSRPESEICRRMMGRVDNQGDTRLVLHDLDSESVRSDIERYMRHELENIPLTDTQWSRIMDRCGTLFIYASTTCRYIEQGYELDALDEAVNTIVDSASMPMVAGDMNAIDNLYLTILSAAFDKSRRNNENKTRMKNVLETVICAIEPMTLDGLASLLGLRSTKQVDGLLQPLRSVLNVIKTTGIVTTLHASFPEFMLTRDRSRNFHCEPGVRHLALAKACLLAIDKVEPKFNICCLPSSHLLDDEVDDLDERVSQAISPGLSYACRYWANHLVLSQYQDSLVDLVQKFFSTRLLVWMEVLNLKKWMRHGTSIMQMAEKWCSNTLVPENVGRLAHDAWQFVSVFAHNVVSQSTPHIYVSMLPFWPRERPISKAYMPRTLGMINPTGTAITRRRLALLGTWKVSGGGIGTMGLSADGTRLVAPTGGSIEVFDTATGGSIFNLTDERKVRSVAISPDGSQIAFSCDDSTTNIWDTRDGGASTDLLPDRRLDIRSIAFSPNQLWIALGSSDGEISICSLEQRELVLGPLEGHTKCVNSVAFSPDSLYLASGSKDQTVCVWDTETGHIIGKPFQGHTNWVRSVSYSPDGSRLASASDDRTIRVWDPQTGQTVLGPLAEHSNWVLSVAFSPDGRFIASGSRDKTIRVYDAQTGQTVLGPLHAHTDLVWSVIFSPDNARLFSCSDDGTIRIWNFQDLDPLNVSPSVPSLSSPIWSVRYSHSGSRIVSGSLDGTIHVWDVQTGQMVLGPLRGHTDFICSVDYSPNDAYIASASDDKTLRIWDGCSGDDLHGPIEGHRRRVSCVRFSPDGSVVASGSLDATVRIWDVKNGQPVTTLLEGNDAIIHSIGFSPDGNRLVCGLRNGTVQVLDRHTSEMVVGPLPAHGETVSSVEFSPDGSRILSSSFDRSIRIWDVQTGQKILECGEHSLTHNGEVNSASFSPDGHYVVSGSDDRTVRVWDAQSGNLILGPLEGHKNRIWSVQFSPDGSHVVSCSLDHSIRFWDVSSCITRTQENKDPDESTADTSGQKVDEASGNWSMDRDGWVVDRQKRRLVWVPSDLQASLLPVLNFKVTTDNDWFQLGFGGVLVRERSQSGTNAASTLDLSATADVYLYLHTSDWLDHGKMGDKDTPDSDLNHLAMARSNLTLAGFKTPVNLSHGTSHADAVARPISQHKPLDSFLEMIGDP
ncbi:hypothetical protein OPQ81_000555 [Rhizoctonia solani]|nr:hypothetical protein OPQ81_000555 [Rhizoctonia solani]